MSVKIDDVKSEKRTRLHMGDYGRSHLVSCIIHLFFFIASVYHIDDIINGYGCLCNIGG